MNWSRKPNDISYQGSPNILKLRATPWAPGQGGEPPYSQAKCETRPALVDILIFNILLDCSKLLPFGFFEVILFYF